MDNKILPRPEFPKPQFKREDWINLNGKWSYKFDFGKTGIEREWNGSKGFEDKILVPFCPESELSGVGYKDFVEMMWYHRKISIPREWDYKLVLLHFGAVDYECEVYIDSKLAGRHFGGSSSFEIDISDFLKTDTEHDLVVMVKDELRSGGQPGGKQSMKYKSAGCHYTRTSGIWQTVWLEAVHAQGLKDCRTVPDLDSSMFIFHPTFRNIISGNKFKTELFDNGKLVSTATSPAVNGTVCSVLLDKVKTWSPENPFLYDVVFSVTDESGKVIDRVESYTGMRKIHVEKDNLFLNNKPVYLRFVLDQGFYSDGIWTAPSDAALKKDIELSMKAGFNGARLHQKVFEERFHYWADKLGYLTWAEFPSWGISLWGGDPHQAGDVSYVSAWNFISEWREVVERDLNHPSIIAWTPLNETRQAIDLTTHNRFHSDIYDLTHSIDPTRPVNDTSGYVHVKTDLWTVQNYEHDPVKLKEQLSPGQNGEVWKNYPEIETAYKGQPYYVDEFGGIKWIPPEKQKYAENSWGYGKSPESPGEFYEKLKAQVDVLLEIPHVRGYCYTQLTDVEQEQNGIYNYDRSEKFDMKKIASIFGNR